ncbi:MAG: PQQ-binding-like beta-propeller repeat protein, partial [Planctomycetes bacterium]|nr:PQQ-binding-like beta-propeller repeat protein [Planctomycetota bacterium]
AGGEVVWRAAVPGRAGSLCVSAGRLVVGTDRGAIVCFGAPAEPRVEISGPSAGGSASPSAPAAAPSAEARGHDAAHPGSGGNPADAGGDGGGGSDGDGGGAAAPTTGGRDAPAPAGGESDDAAARAGELLEACGSRKGYCLIVDAKDASLAVALARRSELSIVCFERDPAIAAAIRADVVRSGLYGSRIAVLRADRPRFSFSGYLFRLVVLPDARSLAAWGPSLLDLPRTVRPEGGVLCAAAGEEETPDPLRRLLERLAAAGREDAQAPFTADRAGPWIVLRRGKVPGAGEWTQLYADAGHTASSGDALRAPLALQWFGRPGPRPMIDRHHRPTSPLCRDGRLFIPADEQIIAVDQYCGTELWRRGIPGSRRVGAMKHSGHLLLDGRSLLVASGSGCVSLDVESGEIRRTLQPPSLQEGLEWGYLGAVGNRLIATGREAGAAFRELRRETCDLLEGDLRPMVASRLLMALDREDGREVWTYHGAILDAAIAASGDRICFLESRDPSMAAAGGGRVRIDELFRGGARLVALAAEDGAALWKREIAPPFQHIAYLSATEDVVLLSGSFNDGDEVFYELMAFEAAGGGEIWRTRFRALDIRGRNPAEPDGTHGEQWQHPVIIAGTVYARPYAFDLQSGEKKDYLLQRGGHGCGGLTGSLHYLFGRGDHPRLYPTDVQLTEGLPITRVSRPGCWLNIIPAGGMVLIPEASSGCTCAYPIQTSFGFVPLSVGSAAGKPPENPAGSF